MVERLQGELNYGYPLCPLALLKQLLLDLVAQEALLELQTILAALPALQEMSLRLVLGYLPEVEVAVWEGLRQAEAVVQVVVVSVKLSLARLYTPQVELLELQQPETVAPVAGIEPGVVRGAVDFQPVQLLQIVEELVEKEGHFLLIQHLPQVAVARWGLLMLAAATALTQPLILLVAMVAAQVALAQLPLAQVAMAVTPVVAAAAAVQVTVSTPVLAATVAMATSVS